jgi:hypothetical protein
MSMDAHQLISSVQWLALRAIEMDYVLKNGDANKLFEVINGRTDQEEHSRTHSHRGTVGN